MNSTSELFNKLLTKGGSIHRSNDIPAHKLVAARLAGNVFVDGEGNSFVWLPRETGAKNGIGFGELTAR